MNNARFLTVADAVRSSADVFEAVVHNATVEKVQAMTLSQQRDTFFPELTSAEFESRQARDAQAA